jgi:predicted NAD/FAD-dependent oxidoreductase
LSTRVPDWDIAYPSDSDIMLVSQGSRKRRKTAFHAFVIQCRASFSRRYLESEPEAWAEAILAEAARLFGEF